MKIAAIKNLVCSSDSSGAKIWCQRLLVFGTGQAATQVLQAISGLLTLWFLPTEQYAYFTIFLSTTMLVNTILGVGVVPGVVSLVGSKTHDTAELGRYIEAAWGLRKVFMLILTPIGAGLMLWAGLKNNFSPMSLGILIAIMPVYFYIFAKCQLYSIPFQSGTNFQRCTLFAVAR